MSQKKPIWTTTEAHETLKAYCQAAGKTQLQVVSNLIMTHLDPSGPRKGRSKPIVEEPETTVKSKPFGGVWVV